MKRSVLDYLENTAKRCPERLAWDASAPFTFGQWWDAAQRIASSLSSRCARNTPRPGSCCIRPDRANAAGDLPGWFVMTL